MSSALTQDRSSGPYSSQSTRYWSTLPRRPCPGRKLVRRFWHIACGTVTNVIVSACSVDHQKRLVSSCMVAAIPGWPELGVEWTNWITLWRSVCGTYVRLGGLSAGGGSVAWASEISVMISHWMGARIRVGEMMDFLVGGRMDDSYCLDRASALVFSKPWRYVNVKLNRVKNRYHLACLWLSRLANFRYSRLRWSINTVKGLIRANDATPRKLLSWREVLDCPHRNSIPQGWVYESRIHRGILWEGHLVTERGLHQYLCWIHPPPQCIPSSGSGWCRIGAEINLYFSSWKADRAVGVHTRRCWPFLNINVNGAAVVLKLRMNLR